MLSALDETLMHQGPVTFDQALTSDHRFFDRMFLGGHCAQNVKFIMGLAAYKNMNAVSASRTARATCSRRTGTCSKRPTPTRPPCPSHTSSTPSTSYRERESSARRS